MAKHVVDIDEDALRLARARFGTKTVGATVNEALRRAAAERAAEVKRSLDRLARLRLDDREHTWL